MAMLLAGVASNRGRVTIEVVAFGGSATIGVGGKLWQCNGKSSMPCVSLNIIL